MKYFWMTLSWLWSKRGYLAMSFLSALLFFAWLFPFGDLSDMVTSKVAQATGNQIYLQFETMNLGYLPMPSLSATKVSVETPGLPPLDANWIKISPGWVNLLLNAWTIKKAATGDPGASASLMTHISGSVAAEGILGGDIDLSLSPGSKGEGGRERSKVYLALNKMNLADVRKWAELSVEIQGQVDLATTLQITPDFAAQPEGDLELQVRKFNLPASTVETPMGPLNMPALTLSNVTLRGRLSNGSLIIEDGSFGGSKDPLNGRIKGQMALRLQPTGAGIQTIFGAYNLTVDLNTSKQIDQDKSMSLAFFLFDSAKTAGANGSKYLFRAQGQGVGVQYPPPTITRITSY